MDKYVTFKSQKIPNMCTTTVHSTTDKFSNYFNIYGSIFDTVKKYDCWYLHRDNMVLENEKINKTDNLVNTVDFELKNTQYLSYYSLWCNGQIKRLLIYRELYTWKCASAQQSWYKIMTRHWKMVGAPERVIWMRLWPLNQQNTNNCPPTVLVAMDQLNDSYNL